MLLRLLRHLFSPASPGADGNAVRDILAIPEQPQRKKVLNVGGNSKDIPIPQDFDGWEHVLLDIDPKGKPDVVCDARKMKDLPAAQYDAVYCSHNLEHYYRHEVATVLEGFRHVLKSGGFAYIAVPDIGAVMAVAVARQLDVDDVLYQSPAGPITVHDVLYGWGPEIARSGKDYFAHKSGFTQRSLQACLEAAGFHSVVCNQDDRLNLLASGFK